MEGLRLGITQNWISDWLLGVLDEFSAKPTHALLTLLTPIFLIHELKLLFCLFTENCNYAVELGNLMRFSLVGIGGMDIYDMNETLTMALLWQMLRAYTLKVLESLSSGGIKDAQIVEWVNATLEKAGKAARISGFRDRQITTGHVILDVIEAIRPGVIREDLIQDGTTPEVGK